MTFGDDDWLRHHAWQLGKQLRDYRGEKFLSALPLVLSRLFDTRFAFISVALRDKDQAQAMFVADRGNAAKPFYYQLSSAPCQHVFHGKTLAVPCDLSQQYVAEFGLNSYVGVPLRNRSNQVIGVLVIADDRVLVGEQRAMQLLQQLSSHCSAELELFLPALQSQSSL